MKNIYCNFYIRNSIFMIVYEVINNSRYDEEISSYGLYSTKEKAQERVDYLLSMLGINQLIIIEIELDSE